MSGSPPQPPLAYVAPELVASSTQAGITPSSDMFSLGAVAYELLTKRQLLPVGRWASSAVSRMGSVLSMRPRLPVDGSCAEWEACLLPSMGRTIRAVDA